MSLHVTVPYVEAVASALPAGLLILSLLLSALSSSPRSTLR